MACVARPVCSSASVHPTPRTAPAVSVSVTRTAADPFDPGAAVNVSVPSGATWGACVNVSPPVVPVTIVSNVSDCPDSFAGPALIPLGNEATRQVKLVRTTLDRVSPLAAEYGLSFAVAQPIGPAELRIISRFYPPGVHVGITIGSAYGPLDGALGKVLLASKEEPEARKLIKGSKLPAHTRATITSPESLIEEIGEVREKGWSVSHGEFNENNAVAAGIWGNGGELELVLLALGFPTQLDSDRLGEIGKVLKATADEIMAGAGAEAPR